MKFIWTFFVTIFICANHHLCKSHSTYSNYLELLSNPNRSENSSKQFDQLNQSLVNYLSDLHREREKNDQPKWFKIQFKTLKEHDLIIDYPDDLFPLNEEWIWFDENFLIDFSWINETSIADDQVYILKGNNFQLLQPFPDHTIQDFYIDPKYDFRKFLTQTSTNSFCSKQIKALQLVVSIKIESHERNEVFLVFLDLYRSYSVGKFSDLQMLSYNPLPKEILDYEIAIKRPLLDYHYQKETELELFGYNDAKTIDNLEEENYVAILPFNYQEYIFHLGRFNRFVESLYLLFLNVLDKSKKQYYRPYRIVNKDDFDQKERSYYAIPKDRIKEVFKLQDGDNSYLAIFNKVEGETVNPNEIWISDQFLVYLKSLNHNLSESEFRSLNHKEMVNKMCTLQNGQSTRLISLFMVIDYSPFTEETAMYQHSFNSKLLLRWTCFSLNQQFCIERSTAIACQYILKNYPSKEFRTIKHTFKPTNFEKLSNDLINLDIKNITINKIDNKINANSSTFVQADSNMINDTKSVAQINNRTVETKSSKFDNFTNSLIDSKIDNSTSILSTSSPDNTTASIESKSGTQIDYK